MIENFLQGSSRYYEFPSFGVAIYSVLLALVLSSAIAFVFKFTYRGNNFPTGFFQAMILGAIATSMIMMAVGDNIAVGFSIIGVIAIIRFRIQFQNTRNVIFIFAAISVGVATGAYGYSIALAGTSIFCLVAILLYYSPYGQNAVMVSRVEFVINEDQDYQQAFEELKKWVKNEELVEVRGREIGVRYSFRCTIPENQNWIEIEESLSSKATEVRIDQLVREESM